MKDFTGRLKTTPKRPGVYLMRDANNKVLYVGKASDLRNRLRSYFQASSTKEPKIKRLMRKVVDYEYVVTETPSEALILENLLIKRHRPFYNARLKDDKTYPYIKIDLNEAFPQLYFTRRVLDDGAKYFGPFASASSVRTTMDLLKKLFPYRSCTKLITGNDERPCLEFHIQRCVGPCIGAVNQKEYLDVIRQAIMFLEGKTEIVLKGLHHRMRQASDSMKYEKAGVLRDQIRAIESVMERQKIVTAKQENLDAIAIAADQGEIWVELFKVRRGKMIGRDHFAMEGGDFEEAPRLLEQFIGQYYLAATSVPSLLLVEHSMENVRLIESWLSTKKGQKVSVITPHRGYRKQLLDLVSNNAQEGLRDRRAKWLSESDKVFQALTELQEYLNLPAVPNRIECYDISNTQGAQAVGSMVVFENGKPKPSHYRRFRIKSVDGIDDYSMMQEVLNRRFKRLDTTYLSALPAKSPLAQEDQDILLSPSHIKYRRRKGRRSLSAANGQTSNGENTLEQDAWKVIPTMVLIDGGKGHLTAALQVFLDLGITNIPLASIAKQREEIFLPNVPEPVLLNNRSQGLYLLQRIRDEAHRFAITYHRQRRSRVSIQSALDLMPGIGPKRKRLLLRHFGTIQEIRNATVDQLSAVPGISVPLAQQLAAIL